jgi:hypothetical protein
MEIDENLEKKIDNLGIAIANCVKNCFKNDEFTDDLRGFQIESLDNNDGVIYQIPFKVVKTTSTEQYDKCMEVNARKIVNRELLESIRHELVSHSGLLAVDREDCYSIECIRDNMIIELDFKDLIKRIDGELERLK